VVIWRGYLHHVHADHRELVADAPHGIQQPGRR
jgi:hypothetical protein